MSSRSSKQSMAKTRPAPSSCALDDGEQAHRAAAEHRHGVAGFDLRQLRAEVARGEDVGDEDGLLVGDALGHASPGPRGRTARAPSPPACRGRARVWPGRRRRRCPPAGRWGWPRCTGRSSRRGSTTQLPHAMVEGMTTRSPTREVAHVLAELLDDSPRPRGRGWCPASCPAWCRGSCAGPCRRWRWRSAARWRPWASRSSAPRRRRAGCPRSHGKRRPSSRATPSPLGRCGGEGGRPHGGGPAPWSVAIHGGAGQSAAPPSLEGRGGSRR